MPRLFSVGLLPEYSLKLNPGVMPPQKETGPYILHLSDHECETQCVKCKALPFLKDLNERNSYSSYKSDFDCFFRRRRQMKWAILDGINPYNDRKRIAITKLAE